MRKSILFIGGGGFIGSSIIRFLSKNPNYEIHVLEPEFANVKRLNGIRVSIHRGELDNYDKLNLLLINCKIDIVVHLVSTLTPGSNYNEFVKEFVGVVFPTIQLMHICASKGIKFVYFSSGGTIYGHRSHIEPFTEEEHMAPISHYGWLKQMVENSILFIHRTQGLNYLILRPSNPYGPGQSLFGAQGLIAVAIGKILTNEKIEIWGDGSSVRDYIYIDDLSQIVTILIEKDVENVTLNVGSGKGYSVNEVIEVLKRVVGDDNVKIEYKNSRPIDVNSVILDTQKLQSVVPYKLTPIFEGISKFYDFAAKSI